jgi:hypothetical protein
LIEKYYRDFGVRADCTPAASSIVEEVE